MNAQWEGIGTQTIATGVLVFTHRMPVPGGWLYRTTTMLGLESIAVAMTFVSDPQGTEQSLMRQREQEIALHLGAVAEVLEQRKQEATHET